MPRHAPSRPALPGFDSSALLSARGAMMLVCLSAGLSAPARAVPPVSHGPWSTWSGSTCTGCTNTIQTMQYGSPVSWIASSDLSISGTLTNPSGAVFDLQSATLKMDLVGQYAGSVVNQGTFALESTSSASAVLDAAPAGGYWGSNGWVPVTPGPFDNRAGATLYLMPDPTHDVLVKGAVVNSGTIIAISDVFALGNPTAPAQTVFSGPVQLNGGSSIQLGSLSNGPGSNIGFSNNTVAMSGTVNVSRVNNDGLHLMFDGASLTGNAQIVMPNLPANVTSTGNFQAGIFFNNAVNQGTLAVGDKVQLSGRFTNQGSFAVSTTNGAPALDLMQSTVIDNQGRFALASNRYQYVDPNNVPLAMGDVQILNRGGAVLQVGQAGQTVTSNGLNQIVNAGSGYFDDTGWFTGNAGSFVPANVLPALAAQYNANPGWYGGTRPVALLGPSQVIVSGIWKSDAQNHVNSGLWQVDGTMVLNGAPTSNLDLDAGTTFQNNGGGTLLVNGSLQGQSRTWQSTDPATGALVHGTIWTGTVNNQGGTITLGSGATLLVKYLNNAGGTNAATGQYGNGLLVVGNTARVHASNVFIDGGGTTVIDAGGHFDVGNSFVQQVGALTVNGELGVDALGDYGYVNSGDRVLIGGGSLDGAGTIHGNVAISASSGATTTFTPGQVSGSLTTTSIKTLALASPLTLAPQTTASMTSGIKPGHFTVDGTLSFGAGGELDLAVVRQIDGALNWSTLSASHISFASGSKISFLLDSSLGLADLKGLSFLSCGSGCDYASGVSFAVLGGNGLDATNVLADASGLHFGIPAVPEPSSAGLLLAGLLTLTWRKRRMFRVNQTSSSRD